MSQLRERLDVRDVGVRVAEGLDEDRFRIVLDGGLHFVEVMDVHECRGDPVLRKRMGQQVEAAAVNGLLCDDVSAVRGQGLDGVGDGGCAGGDRQGSAAALERGDALFEDALGGVRQSPIDVAGVGKAEAVCRVLAVMEDIGCGLVDGDGAGIGCRVRLLLADVELQGLEFIVAHDVLSFLNTGVVCCVHYMPFYPLCQ